MHVSERAREREREKARERQTEREKERERMSAWKIEKTRERRKKCMCV